MKNKYIKNAIIYSCIILIILFFPFKKKIYYGNGVLMQKFTYKIVSGGKQDGKDYLYNTNGSLYCLHSYKWGKLSGDSKYYYNNGNLKCIVNYKKDKPVHIKEYYSYDGEMIKDSYLINGNGYIKTYHDNGELSGEGKVQNGLKEGEWKIYSNSYIDIETYVKGVDQYGFASEILF